MFLTRIVRINRCMHLLKVLFLFSKTPCTLNGILSCSQVFFHIRPTDRYQIQIIWKERDRSGIILQHGLIENDWNREVFAPKHHSLAICQLFKHRSALIFSDLRHQLAVILEIVRSCGNYIKLVGHSLHDINPGRGRCLQLILDSCQFAKWMSDSACYRWPALAGFPPTVEFRFEFAGKVSISCRRSSLWLVLHPPSQ